jgi:hypothetical protein
MHIRQASPIPDQNQMISFAKIQMKMDNIPELLAIIDIQL